MKNLLIEELRYKVTHKPDIAEIQGTLAALTIHYPQMIDNVDYGAIMASYFMFAGDETTPVFELVKSFEALKDFDTHFANIMTYIDKELS